MTDTEIRVKGIQILAQYLGDIEMERFIALIQREPFDYTQWRGSMEQVHSMCARRWERMALVKSTGKSQTSPPTTWRA